MFAMEALKTLTYLRFVGHILQNNRFIFGNKGVLIFKYSKTMALYKALRIRFRIGLSTDMIYTYRILFYINLFTCLPKQ